MGNPIYNKKEAEKIYNLRLHETIVINALNGSSEFCVTRVIGGWLYENYRLDANQLTSTFIPFNNEFML